MLLLLLVQLSVLPISQRKLPPVFTLPTQDTVLEAPADNTSRLITPGTLSSMLICDEPSAPNVFTRLNVGLPVSVP